MENDTSPVVLDASCAINLYATGKIRDIAIAWTSRLSISKFVLQREALVIGKYRTDDFQFEKDPLDLSELIQEGLIRVVKLADSREATTMAELAASIDDGEAVTAAIAACRQWSMATDDRKASSIVLAHYPNARILSTLDLLAHWARAESIKQSELKAALEEMRQCSGFLPSSRDSQYEWWRAIVNH